MVTCYAKTSVKIPTIIHSEAPCQDALLARERITIWIEHTIHVLYRTKKIFSMTYLVWHDVVGDSVV